MHARRQLGQAQRSVGRPSKALCVRCSWGVPRLTRPTAVAFLAAVVHAPAAVAQIDIARYVTIRAGASPIILSAPHGGDRLLPGVPERTNTGQKFFETVRDHNTAELTDILAAHLTKRHGAAPYVVIARFDRRHIDANRAPEDAYTSAGSGGTKLLYDAYHKAVADFCEQVARRFGHGILLDIHGQARRPEAVIRGTDDGETVAGLLKRHGESALIGPNSIFGGLAAKGYVVAPTGKDGDKIEQLFRGGPIVRTYGSKGGGPIDAIQIELGSRYRESKRLERTAADLAEAIAVFAKAHLPAVRAK